MMELKRFTFFVLAAILFLQCSHQDKRTVKSSNEETDGMEQAMRQEFFKTRDPLLNVIPNERLQTARAYMQTLLPGPTARIMALGWQERGPNNIGGRSRTIMIDKRDATGNTVFAGSISGGIFKTTNFTSPAATWTVVNDQMANLAVSVLLQDKNNFNIMYAGTGEGWFNIGAVRGAGIFKSTDGGTTWNQIPSTAGFEYVQDILIDNNGNLYAALRNLNTTNRGVMRSTDGGTTWTQVLGLPLTDFAYTTGRAADLELASNGDIYATLGIFTRTMVMKSSFAANGANTGNVGAWQEITPVHSEITLRGDIAVAPSNPQRVYLMMQDSLTDQVLTFYRSNDGGASWTPLTAPDALNNGTNSQTWYDLISAVDSTNADVVVVGGLQLAKTTDGGSSWTTISSSPTIHVDQHALVFFNSSRLLIGNDGGIYYSADINTANPSYSQKDNGFSATQFYGCDYHPTDANYFLAGAQDNNTQKFTNPGINSTTPVVGGDGGIPHIRQTDGVLQLAATTGNNYYRSLNSGTTFSALGSVNNNRGQFINPTDFDNAQNILYAGDDMGKYYVVSNLNATASGIVKTITEMGTDRGVTAVKIDPVTANTIWIAASTVDESQTAQRPMVLKIAGANTTPTVQVNSLLPTAVPAGAEISSIDVDPANTNNVLVTVSNYGVPSVWLSVNGGTSWSNVEGNLPDMPIRWGIFAPANAQLNGATGGNGGILLATELGVWTTSLVNGTSTQWIPNNSGFPNVSTYMLKYRASDNLLVAATHGRGLFTTTIPTVVTGVPNITITKDFIKYISAENSKLQIVVGTLSIKNMTIQLYDMKGSLVDKRRNQYQNSTINIERLQTGSYIVKITGDKNEIFVRQFIKR
jgi:photosystem II stability/assembly factor-like uncharacterized protein